MTLHDIILDVDSTQLCPKALFAMGKLQSLHLHNMKLDQRYFLVMAHSAEKSQVTEKNPSSEKKKTSLVSISPLVLRSVE